MDVLPKANSWCVDFLRYGTFWIFVPCRNDRKNWLGILSCNGPGLITWVWYNDGENKSPRIFLCNRRPYPVHWKNEHSECNFLMRNGLHKNYVASRKLILHWCFLRTYCFWGAGCLLQLPRNSQASEHGNSDFLFPVFNLDVFVLNSIALTKTIFTHVFLNLLPEELLRMERGMCI